MRLVTDLSALAPTPRDVVLREAGYWARKGALSVVDSATDADDIAQDFVSYVAAKLDKNPWHLSGDEDRKKVAITAGKNRGVSWLKAQRTREEDLDPEALEEFEATRAPWDNPDMTLEERELRSALEHALETLAPDEQELWIAMHDRDLKPKDLDPEHSRSLSVKLSRIKKKLQWMLRRFQPGRET